MLTLKVEASAGVSLRDNVLPEMLDLARRTGCRIEVQGNDTTFWVHPYDVLASLQHAFDRLYPSSRIVAAQIMAPVPRPKAV